MIRLGTQTPKDPVKILDAAIEHFGPKGLGLEIRRRAFDSVYFVGGGGHVEVKVSNTGGNTDVDITSQEWDYDAQKFLEKI